MKFGKFEILADLGQGAMGKVYRAHDPILDRPVALKTVSPALLTGKDTLARFQREARAAARLQHPNIVTIFELGEVEGTHYIAMELVEGLDLGEAMTPPDRFTIEQKVRMVVDVCRGLDFAHKMGVIHRDVKPANIRLTRDGTVKILDFGIARFRGSEATDPNLTQQGMVLGTPSYLSPELVQGAKVDHHADMWAVGVILYEMLAGRRPFEAPTITSLIHKIVSEPLPALDAKALRLPEALAAVATRALDKDRSRRFPDLGEMAKALLAAIGATPPPEMPLDPVVRKRAYEANFAEARRLLTEDDLSGALEAAKRAQTLDNTRTGIVSLIRVIEERLRAATTVRKPPPAVTGSEATRTALATPARTPAPEATVPALAVPPGPLDTATLRARGAGAFREVGTFGEPPATKEAVLSPVADLLAVAGADGAIRLWDLRSRNRANVLRTDLHRRTGHDAAALSPRLLARRLAPRLGPRGRGRAPLGHGEGRGGAGPPAPRRVGRDAGLLARRRDPRHRLPRREPAPLGRRRRPRRRGAPRAGPPARRRHRPRLGGRRRVDPHRPLLPRPAPPRPAPLAPPRHAARARGPGEPAHPLPGRTVHGGGQPRPDGAPLRPRHSRAVGPCSRGCGARPPRCASSPTAASSPPSARRTRSSCGTSRRARPASTLWGPADESFVGLALFGESNHLAVALADGRIRVWGPAA